MQRNDQSLASVGPVDPVHGFPLWYKDRDGNRLELAVTRDDPATPAMGDPPPVPPPAPFPPDFPDEAFYFLAGAEIPVGGGARPGRARLVLGLEAAFGGTGEVQPGQQMVFARVRIRIDNGAPGGEYLVRHPYGETDVLTADENGRVFVTEDVGTVPGAFGQALAGQVAPFLRWTSGAEKAPGEADPADGYLGDGVTEHTVTGSPHGWNLFRVIGPGVGSLGPQFRDPAAPDDENRVLTRLFTVQGRRSRVAGVQVHRAVRSRTLAGEVTVDVLAGSEAGQAIEVRGLQPAPTPMRAAGERYVARLDAGPALPGVVHVVNTTDAPDTVVEAPVTDAVTVTRVDYDTGARTLTVEAASSDLAVPPALEAVGFGPLPGGSRIFPDVDAPPVTVTVISADGGSDRRTVLLTGPALPQGPVPVPTAEAGADLLAAPGEQVRLDGSGSTGATGFNWAQVAGPDAGPLGGAGTATATFAMPAGNLPVTFRLTVSGPGGPDTTDEVTVSPASDTLEVLTAQFRTGSRRWRVTGTATGPAPDRVTVRFGAQTLGTALVDPTGAWDVRLTLTGADPQPVPGDRVTATSTRGGADDADVLVRN